MKDENTFAPLPEHARKVMDAAQEKITKFEAAERKQEDENGAYRAGYAYGVQTQFDRSVSAKQLDFYPDDQTLRIEWDRGYAHCHANRLLGHDVKTLLEQELYWIEDEAALVIELKAKLDKAERLCLDCLNCAYDNAMPGYSEWTPGHGVEFRCNKGKWEFDAFETRRETFKSFLETARDCSDFEEL